MISKIRVRYKLRIPKGARAAVERAVASHRENCPASLSVEKSIPIEISADVTEE